MIEKKAFVPYRLEEERNEKHEVITLKLNKQERAKLEELKSLIHQEKDGTAIKNLMSIASNVLRQPETMAVLEVVLNNYRKNKRLGIVKFEQK